MALSGIPNPYRAGRLALAEKCQNWAEKCQNWTKTWRNLKWLLWGSAALQSHSLECSGLSSALEGWVLLIPHSNVWLMRRPKHNWQLAAASLITSSQNSVLAFLIVVFFPPWEWWQVVLRPLGHRTHEAGEDESRKVLVRVHTAAE